MPSLKSRSIAITFRPTLGITDDTINRIIDLLLPFCEYYHFVTEKFGVERHLHAALFLIDAYECKYFTKKIKSEILKIVENCKDGSIYRRAYKAKSIYNDDWLNRYCKKDSDVKVCKTFLPKDRSKLPDYYRETLVKRFKDSVHSEFEEAILALYPERLSRGYTEQFTAPEVEQLLCTQMYIDRTRRPIQEPRKMKNLIYSLLSYINKKNSYTWHSKVERDDPHYVKFSCQECGYFNVWPLPESCPHHPRGARI